MDTILVTGGTGTLGRAVVEQLNAGPHDVRVLSRHPGPASEIRVVGDLLTGAGLADAVNGVSTIVHCATTNGKGDIAATRNLIVAAQAAGTNPHLLYISIVGVDRIELPYYQSKLAAEKLIIDSGLPWTVLRATQFHDLLATIFAVQRWLPVTFVVRRLRFQPIDVRDVAKRLTELVEAGPTGRAPDIGGPEIFEMRELARIYQAEAGHRRPIATVALPGAVVRQYAAGHNLVPDNAIGVATFAQHLAQSPGLAELK
ncbi:SDR family oxidoreductase [Corynebacterium sp. A21]|uniref:SDR family oxidoreductase n=1 Tax=Corynebacterium sp. A21 TaxID=3457318 RepID=UPI003FD199E0